MQKEVAIIGYSCRLPGAPDRDAYWRLLSESRCAVSQIPPDHFSTGAYLHPQAGPAAPGRSYTFAAGVIDDVWGFDAAAFGISPREAEQIDPQQRHLLEVAYEAIEHSGLRPSRLSGSRIGVYVGASSSDYATRFMFDPDAIDVHMMTGNTLSIVSNRLSYVFDFKGPSFTVDTACSSSLVAMHVALEAIRNDEIDTAVVGGVNMLLSPFSFVGFSRASMLSRRGLCRAFDAAGDGYVRAEGAVAVVLRSMDAARRNGDRIRAVVAGSGINQDGRTNGLSLPSWEAQAALLESVYRKCGIAPDAVAFAEAHGTGTRAGDPMEAEALGRVLGRPRSTPLPIGSVKTNIGHLEPASGLAGVLKAALALRHGVLPASLHFETPNPDIKFDELNLRVNVEPTPLEATRGRRHAAINSFGFGGANAHVVLREPEACAAAQVSVRDDAPLVVSAHSSDALKAMAARYVPAIRAEGEPAVVSAVAHARDMLPERLTVIGPDKAAKIETWLAGEAASGVLQGRAVGRDLDVAYAFAGNGSQWAGMGIDALRTNAEFAASLLRFDEAFAPLAGWSAVESLRSANLGADIRRAERAQPLLLALQVATVDALRERGVVPTAVVGHSVGEIAAAWCAGVLSIADAIRVVLARSRRQEATRLQGGMAAVLVAPEEMARLLDRGAFAGLEVAAINSKRGVTVSGPTATLDAFVRFAEQERWGVRRLDLDYPFHCAIVDPIKPLLAADLAGLSPRAGAVPFFSSVAGEAIDGTSLDGDYWWRNVRQPVLFADAVGKMCAAGARVLVEISPKAILGGYLNDALRRAEAGGAVVSTLGREEGAGPDQIALAAARVLAAGGRVDTDRLVGPRATPSAELPDYAWRRRAYIAPATPAAIRAYAPLVHPLLGGLLRADELEWRSDVDPALRPWLGGHRVDGSIVFPASAFIEVALAAARQMFPDGPIEVRDLDIFQPLVFGDDEAVELRTCVSHDTRVVDISSRRRGDAGDWLLHARGSLAQSPVAEQEAPALGPSRRSFSREEIYRLTAARGFGYAGPFASLERADFVDGESGYGRLADGRLEDGDYLVDPARLDSAFHVWFVAEEDGGGADRGLRFLPVRFPVVRLFAPRASMRTVTLRIATDTPFAKSGDLDLLDADGRVVLHIGGMRLRAMPQAGEAEPESLVYRTDFVRSARASELSAATDCFVEPVSTMLAAAGDRGDAQAPGDVSLLLDAGAQVSAWLAARAVAGSDSSFAIPALVADGRLATSAWPLLSRALWGLADAGLATEREGVWSLAAGHDLPTIPDLVAALLSKFPAYAAEAVALAALPDALSRSLAEGLEGGAALGRATLEHAADGSPSVAELRRIVRVAARAMVRRWPKGRPLDVLVLGDEGTARDLAPRVARRHGRIVLADAPEGAGVAGSMTGLHPRLHRLPWDELARASPGGYDAIICADALPMAATVPGRLDALAHVLRPGGVLMAAERAPSLFDDLVFGQTTAWWTASAHHDFPSGARLSADEWTAVLEGAGLHGVVVRAATAGLLVGASAPTRQRKGVALEGAARSFVVARTGALDSRVLADLLRERLGGASSVLALRGESRTSDGETRHVRVVDAAALDTSPNATVHIFDSQPATDLIFVAARRADPADPVAESARHLAQLAGAVREAGDVGCARIWLVTTGALSGVVDDKPAIPFQAALVAGVRTLQNEHPAVELRCLDLAPDMGADVAATRVAEAVAQPGREREVRLDDAGASAVRIACGGVFGRATDGSPQTRATRRLVASRRGGNDALRWESAPLPALGPKDVEVDVAAAGLNFRDVMWSLGLLPEEALESGFGGPSIGMEFSGTVAAVGVDVDGLSVGDAVLGFAAHAFSSTLVAPASSVAKAPAGSPLEAAATIPVAFFTAQYALVHLARLKPGESVLIHGGAGGVGLAALQVAKASGARVFATAGSADKRALLRALGADHVLDSRTLAFAEQVKELTGGRGVDVVLNSLAAEAMERSIGCLAPFGRFLELGKRDFYANRAVGLRPFRNNLSYFGVDVDQLLAAQPESARELLAEVMKGFADGSLTPLPYRVFDGADAADAFRLMQRSGHVGKILVRPRIADERPQPLRRFAFDPQGLYVIVGGAGGFGLATAAWLVDRGVRRIALLGRSTSHDPTTQRRIGDLRLRGARVDVVAVDAADAGALDRNLRALERDGVRIRGVFHAAMVLDDALAAGLSAERMAAVLRPKVAGAQNLDRLTRRCDLDCFVLFSSVAALVGNPGQLPYVAANGWLDAVARRRRAEGLPALSVAWGAIGDVGYLSRHDDSGRVLSQRLGASSLTAAEALAGLDRMLELDPRRIDRAAIAFARVDWTMAKKELATVSTAAFDDLHLAAAAADGGGAALAEILQMIRDLPEAEVERKVADLIAAKIAQILRLQASDVQRATQLAELGMDSLLMLELRASVEQSLGLELPLMALTGARTVNDVSKRLVGVLKGHEKAALSGPMAALAQGHVDVPSATPSAEVAAVVEIIEQRAKSVDRIL